MNELSNRWAEVLGNNQKLNSELLLMGPLTLGRSLLFQTIDPRSQRRVSR